MLIAAAAVPATVSTEPSAPAAPPAGWSPTSLVAYHSRFGDSALRSVWGTWRGVREAQEGQALTSVMVDRLAPLMSEAFGLGAAATRDALQAVRIFVGGPVRQFGAAAVVLSNRVYVRDEGMLGRITSWDGRRLLVHELGHVLQRERITPASARWLGGGELGRDRVAMLRYVAGVPNASIRGTFDWIAERLPGRDGNRHGLGDLIHDAHRLEREAEDVALRIRDQLG